MRKMSIISDKIKNSKSNYFGRGHFETIIKENKSQILEWFENLVPVQEQIKELTALGCDNLQKRNYVRIITKLFPQEYGQFISMNILLRDIDAITAVVKGIHDTRKQYDTLTEHLKLKFPGRHHKFVDFHTYQQFVTFYKEDLINRAQNFEIDESIEIEPHQQYIYNVYADKKTQKTQEVKEEEPEEEIVAKTEEIKEEEAVEEKVVEPILETKDDKAASKVDKDNKTNWMKVLLKGV